MDIIEKLGIKPIPLRDFGSGDYCVDKRKVRKLEQQNNEMLEALVIMGMENTSYEERHDNCRKIAEKIAKMPWSKIKELYNEK